MITWSWHEQLSPEELAEVEGLLVEAAEYDEEAGFATATPAAPSRGEVHHLLVAMPPRGARGSAALDRLPDVRVVAYLRLDVVAGTAVTQFVVRPHFRSLGVATLLFERLASEPEGWAHVPGLRDLRAWAHGAHPAADRIKMRFGGSVEHAVFKTLRPVGGSRPFRTVHREVMNHGHASSIPELVPGHHLALNPADRAVLDRARTAVAIPQVSGGLVVGVDEADPAHELAPLGLVRDEALRRDDLVELLGQGLLVLQDKGARMVMAYLDALDDEVVAASRILGFEHDQTDLLYGLSPTT